MPKLPSPDERHEKKNGQEESRDDDGAPHLGAAGEIFQKLEEKQKIPFWPRRRKWFGRICRRAEFRAGLMTEQARPENEKQNRCQHCKTRHSVFQNLVGPESAIGAALRFFGGEAMAAEQVR